MKSVIAILLVIVLLSTSFVFALDEGSLVVNRPEDLEAEKDTLVEKLELVYTAKGRSLAEAENNQKLEDQKNRYEQVIDNKNNRIQELEAYISSDYENYAYYFYQMTENQFLEFCAVVQAEGKTYRNQIAITQTAINLALAFGNTPYYWMCQSGAYTTPEETVWKSTKENVMAVFLDGARVTSRPIKYFYSYTMMPEGSKWHESQIYVMTIDDHNFYE